MAMIKCRECGNEISSRAESCPHCGAKTRFGAEEAEKKEMNTTAVVLLIVSIVGTLIFFAGLMTMFGDIDTYHNSWYGGYNYKSPLTDHEVGVIMQMVFGLALDIGCSIGFAKVNKNAQK